MCAHLYDHVYCHKARFARPTGRRQRAHQIKGPEIAAIILLEHDEKSIKVGGETPRASCKRNKLGNRHVSRFWAIELYGRAASQRSVIIAVGPPCILKCIPARKWDALQTPWPRRVCIHSWNTPKWTCWGNGACPALQTRRRWCVPENVCTQQHGLLGALGVTRDAWEGLVGAGNGFLPSLEARAFSKLNFGKRTEPFSSACCINYVALARLVPY